MSTNKVIINGKEIEVERLPPTKADAIEEKLKNPHKWNGWKGGGWNAAPHRIDYARTLPKRED